MINEPTLKRESEISIELSKLSGEVESVGEKLNNLAERLSSVLLQTTNEAKELKVKEKDSPLSLCELADRIRVTRHSVNVQNNQLSAILEKLQL